jgi:glycogen debranching enzyme
LIGRLRRRDLMTTYGLRTLSAQSPFYAPFTHHRGNVWPFDNAVLRSRSTT